MKYSEQAELVAGLRSLADFLEAHGHKLPTNIYKSTPRMVLSVRLDSKENMALAARTLAKAGGTVKKDFQSSYASVIKQFSELVNMEFWSNREAVCTKRVVGTKQVPKTVATTVTIPGEYVDEEIVEWDCDPILAEV